MILAYMCIKTTRKKKLKDSFSDNEESQVSLISQHVFLDLLYMRPWVRGGWKIPKKQEMSFLAMGDKTQHIKGHLQNGMC